MRRSIRKAVTTLGLLLLGAVCFAAPAKGPKPTIFRKQPSVAAKMLKVTATKPFTAGFVFIEGKYVPPPYKVERYGTVIRINGIQVSDPIVPWEEFLKTQRLRDVKSAADAELDSDADAESEAEPEDEVESKAELQSAPVEEMGDFANIDDIDDLFDTPSPSGASSAPTPRASSPAPRTAAKKPAPRAKRPAQEVDGEFELNDRAKALLARVNNARKDVDALLRKGGYVCFLSGCSSVTGDAIQSRRLMETLPETMRDSSDEESFLRKAREAGLTYLPVRVLRGFGQNRIDYPLLMERRKVWQEGDQWKKALNGSSQSF